MENTERRVALVTGGAQGIGRSIALALAGAGADIAIVDLNPEGVASAVAAVVATGRRAFGFTGDVSSLAFAQEAVQKTIEAAGALHVLVNNAGITRDGLILRMKSEDWDAVLRVNLTGSFNFCKAAVPGLIKQRWGRIVNISSVVGAMGNAGQVNYAASKAGLIGLTKSLAREVASRGVTVNAVAPGFIDTAMTQAMPAKARETLIGQIPAGRLGQAEDVAAAVAYLASEGASYVTGQVLHVNGGMYT
jgi:3-oxoacyl-[acyl-carrier protein] reductase